MSMRRIAALQAGFLFLAVLANAASSKNTMQITVLDSVTRASSPIDNGVPKNCDGITFDAYCRSTTNVPLVNTLLVQEGDNPPFRITCTIESRFSRCTPLPKGATFDARREKKGVTVYYIDDKGKLRKQFYTFVDGDTNAGAKPSMAKAGIQPAPAPREDLESAPVAEAAAQKLPGTVKCSFSSTPAGAEVTLDGRYVGSTPSVLGVTTGNHVVVISMAGFAQWKRELAVSGGSELTVNAVLQKTQ